MTAKPKVLENLKKVMEKVMESEEVKRVRTLQAGAGYLATARWQEVYSWANDNYIKESYRKSHEKSI